MSDVDWTHPELQRFHDPKLTALADVMGVQKATAIGLREMLLELSIDYIKSPDLTDVPAAQWGLAFSVPIDWVQDMIDCFVEAKLLVRADGKLLLADWEKHASDERSATYRSWWRDYAAGFDDDSGER